MAPVHHDALLSIWHTTDPPGLRAAGEVDLTNQAALIRHLGAMAPAGPEVTVDLRAVTFLSFRAVHDLLVFAQHLEPGRRLVLHSGYPLVARMLTACGWDPASSPLILLETIPDGYDRRADRPRRPPTTALRLRRALPFRRRAVRP